MKGRIAGSGVTRRSRARRAAKRVIYRAGKGLGLPRLHRRLVFPDGALVPVRRLERTYRDALQLLARRQGPESLGDYLEFGVYQGASLACMHRATAKLGLADVRMFGFDSFQGLPAAGSESYDGTKWRPGEYAMDEEAAREYLDRQGVDWKRVCLTKGWFDEALTRECAERLNIVKASVIMVDCDLYSSARKALEFCAPLIDDEAVILFDDWRPGAHDDRTAGEKRAFEEFLAAHRHFTATELESYYPRAAKVFLVSRTTAAGPFPQAEGRTAALS